MSLYDGLTILNLQTNEKNILSYEGSDEGSDEGTDEGSNEGAASTTALFKVNNKIISVDYDYTIKIWNLNDLKLFKIFKNKNKNKKYLEQEDL